MSNYEIKNLDEFTQSARLVVFSCFGKNDEQINEETLGMLQHLSDEEEREMDEVLTQQESKIIVESLVHKKSNKKNNKIKYIITEKIFSSIIEALNARLVSNILFNLSKKGCIESAYDDKMNDFIFWVKEENNNDN